MRFIRFNDLASVSWYHHLWDAVIVLCFLIAAVASARAYRRGRRDYAIVMATAFLYGLLLELSGMIWHRSYVQGEFAVMLRFKSLALFAESTDMPLYVPLFYPTFLFLGYKLAEPFGIARPWQRAVAGGFVMGLLDTPYIIQGGLRDIVWWTWGDWWLYQLWHGWPLVDLWWEMTWHAFLFWSVHRVTPRVDRWHGGPGPASIATHVKTLIALPLALGIGVNLVGPLLHVPLTVPTALGADQAPLVALLVLVFGAIVLLAEKAPRPELDRVNAWAIGLYVGAFAVMVAGNVAREGRFPDYAVVQSVALFALGFLTLYPSLQARRGRAAATAPSERGGAWLGAGDRTSHPGGAR